MCPRATSEEVKQFPAARRRRQCWPRGKGLSPVQVPLLWLLLNANFFTTSATAVAEMCSNIRDDLSADSCSELLDGQGKGFRLTGTLTTPLSYNGASFDVNIDGPTAGANNVCMLAAFGNGGTVPVDCVPVTGTQAKAFDGDPGPFYLGDLGDSCGYNFVTYGPGHTIIWNYPLGYSCAGSPSDEDLGLTEIDCYFSMECELGTTTTTMIAETSTITSSTSHTTTISTSITQTSSATSITSTTSTTFSTSITHSTSATSITSTTSTTFSTSITHSTSATSITSTTFSTSITHSTSATSITSTTFSTSITTITTSLTSITSTDVGGASDSTSTTRTTSSTLTVTSLTATATQTSVVTTVTQTTSATKAWTTVLNTATATSTTSTFVPPTTTQTLTSATATETLRPTTLTATAMATSYTSTSPTQTMTETVADTETPTASVTTTAVTAALTSISSTSAETTETRVTSTRTTLSTSLNDGTEQGPCTEIPQITNSLDLDACVGTANGQSCPVICMEGYVAQDSLLWCQHGRWQVRGECILEGINVTEAAAAQILLHVNLDLEGSNESDGVQWAQQHLDPLYTAFATTMDVHPAELRLQLLASSMPVIPDRRLAQVLNFDVRLTLLLGVMNVSNRSQQTVQVLEYLAGDPGMSRFEEGLRNALNAQRGNSLLRAYFGALSTTEVIDSYWLPEAVWVNGPWDSACQSCAAMETREVTCSRGSWLLCSGPMEGLAGPQPSSQRPCGQCADAPQMMMASVWMPLAGLVVGLCCCVILGMCIARRCLRFVSRWMPQQSFSGQQALGEVGMQASYHVERGLRPMKSRISSGDEGEGGFLRRLKTMKSTATGRSSQTHRTERSGAEMRASKTKVVWDLDADQLSSMMQKTRSLRSLRDNGNAQSPTSPSTRDGARMSSFELDLDDTVSAQKSDRSGRSGRPLSPSSPARRQASNGTLLESGNLSPVARADTEITVMQSSI